MQIFAIVALISVIVILILSVLVFLARYKKCPPDKILVVYGSLKKGSSDGSKSSKCIHGGGQFVWPFFQNYTFMDLTPISISVDLLNALSRQNIRISVPSRFTVGISTEAGVMQNAAERLRVLKLDEIQDLAQDIIFGQMRLIIATMDIEEINTDRDKFLEAVSSNVETELKKIGLKLINVNVTDITDESGYIQALGKEAAAKAINDAKKSVAEKNRDGSVGEAQALKDQRIQVAEANSIAIAGENTYLGNISQSDANRREIEADAKRRAVAAEAVAVAKALEESYIAEKEAELGRASREKATLEADVIIKTEIEKERKIIEAEAEAEQIRRLAKGEADAIYAKLQAEAKGNFDVLNNQALGLAQIVKAANDDTNAAIQLIVANKLEELTKLQTEAIKNIKIDKVTVWDSGKGAGEKSSTADFLSGLYKSVPPLKDIFNQVGLDIPSFMGSKLSDGEDEIETNITVDIATEE